MRACHGAVTAAGAPRRQRLRLAKCDIAEAFEAADRRRARDPDVWGAGASPVALEFEGVQAVLVHRQLFTKRDCRTVGDFLRFYLAHRLPQAWCETLEAAEGAGAMLGLAHDLYELEHAALLPRSALKRLQLARRGGQTRRELAFAATLLRAGFAVRADLAHAVHAEPCDLYRLGGTEAAAPAELARDLAETFASGQADLLLLARLPPEVDPELAASAAVSHLKALVKDRHWGVALLIFEQIGASWTEAHLLLPTAGLARGEVRSRLVSPSADLRRRRPALHALLDWRRRSLRPFDLPLIAGTGAEAIR